MAGIDYSGLNIQALMKTRIIQNNDWIFGQFWNQFLGCPSIKNVRINTAIKKRSHHKFFFNQSANNVDSAAFMPIVCAGTTDFYLTVPVWSWRWDRKTTFVDVNLSLACFVFGTALIFQSRLTVATPISNRFATCFIVNLSRSLTLSTFLRKSTL